MKSRKKDIVQVLNPRTGRYVKVDRENGLIIAHKRTRKPYKGIPIVYRAEVKLSDF